jgi:tRNA G46 methylase TrmB
METHIDDRSVGSRDWVKPGLILDIGANSGQTLLNVQATHRAVTHIGIEPNPQCVAYVTDFTAIP